MKKRTFNRVRTDKLEVDMGHLLARFDHDGFNAIWDLSMSIGAPVDIEYICKRAIEQRVFMYGNDIDTSDIENTCIAKQV